MIPATLNRAIELTKSSVTIKYPRTGVARILRVDRRFGTVNMSSFLKEKNAPIRKEPHVKSYSFLQIIETAVELTTISIIFFTPTDQPQS